MLKLSICDPYDAKNPYKILKPINFNTKGVSKLTFRGDINNAYQLKIEINPKLTDAFDFLRESAEAGLRLTTDDFDLGFIKNFDPQVDRPHGVTILEFYSSIWKLKESLPIMQDRPYSGSASEYISRIDPQFAWTLISPDKKIVLQLNKLDNFSLLKKVCDQAQNWSFRENGLINVGTSSNPKWKTEIIYGDFDYIDDYYQATKDVRFKTYKANPRPRFDNPFDVDTLRLDDASIEYKNIITHLRCYGDVGQGTADASTLKLTDTNAPYINNEFPLVSLQNPETKTRELYIKNNKVNKPYYKVSTLTVSLSSSSKDELQQSIITLEDAQKYLYDKGVAWLDERNEESFFKYSYTPRKFILPGNKVDIRYKEVNEQLDGSKRIIFDINEQGFLRNLKLDLATIRN